MGTLQSLPRHGVSPGLWLAVAAVTIDPYQPTAKDPSSFTLIEAAQYGNLERCRWLVEEQGADVMKADAEGITPLHWAAINNRFAVARYDMV